MKTLRYLILSWLATAMVCHATQPVQVQIGGINPAAREAAIQSARSQVQNNSQNTTNSVPGTPVAEAVTADLQTLADGLQNDPVQIFNYVHDHIRHVLYFGSKKGAELTYLEKSGNDFDQCALLVALLRAAGYTNTGYQFGWMEIPYDATDGTHNDLHHWLQLNLTNSASTWSYTTNYLDTLIRVYRGYPADAAIWGNNTFAFQRIWVTLTNGSTVYYLDPSFKDNEPIPGINLTTAMGFSSSAALSNALMSAAGGTDTGTYVTNMTEAPVRSALTSYAANLLNYIQSNCPNATVAQILSGWQIMPSTNTTLPTSLRFPTYTWGGQMPLLSWANEPTNLMSSLSISFEGTNFTCYIPQLEGQRLTLTYDDNAFAQLWLEDTDVADNYASSGTVTISVAHPVGYWNTNNNSFVNTGAFNQSTTNNYLLIGSYYYPPYFNAYNIMYAFEPDWGWLQERQDWMAYLRSYGLGDQSFDEVCETLNLMGLQYLLETTYMQQILAAQAGMLPQNYQVMGRMAQENGYGYYFDIFMWKPGDFTSTGADATNATRFANYSGSLAYFGSAFENGVIEQLQSGSLLGVSTIKTLELAVTNKQAVFLANSNNWANVRASLSGYGSGDLNVFATLVAQGDTVLLPGYGFNSVGGWSGYGYVDHASSWNFGMLVSGQYGGWVSDPNATVNPTYVALAGQLQPRRGPFAVHAVGADPVELATGAFQVDHTDLSLGQPEPRGLSLGRYYNSGQRYLNAAGMAPGWINNYCVNAQVIPAPQASLGGTTPAQMAPMIAATCAALDVYNDGQPDPKNWTVTALIAKWGIDQLNKTGVSVQMGKDIVQFVRQPNGTFTPPANCNWALTQSGNFALQPRHGSTFGFDSQGRLSSITDQYNQALNLIYNSSNWVQSATDWKGRSLTFNYSGTPLHLTSVSDSTGRSVSYGYTLNSYDNNFDLTSVTDPANKISRYVYNSDHGLKATYDALNRLVTTNIYDGSLEGRVITQFTEGNTNMTRQVYWSKWKTVVQDPVGSKQSFFYDDKSRLVGFQDAFGNLGQTFFDGQDHLVMTVSPLNETNQFIYDGNNNLIAMIDPLGVTNQFVYDGNNNLIRSIDGRGNISTFGYNSQFSLTGSTNGARDYVNFFYNSDGTLYTRTDSGGTTQYGYDSYGQLNSITYPNSLGSEIFINNTLGDPTSHTDARGFATTFQYDARRDLTNTVAPTNLTFSVGFDAVGNMACTTDARGNTTTNSWSATGKLLTTTLPPTPQGTPVLTCAYDNRDWLAQTRDPLQNPTQYTNDIAGRLVSVTDPVRRTTTFGFDSDGRRLTAVNAATETSSQVWDRRNDLVSLIDGAGHTSSRGYDGAGNEILLTNRNGKVWQFQFDGANRLTNTISPLSHSSSATYNHQGLIATVNDPANQPTSFGYDGKGRLTNRTDNVATNLYGYDANDNRTSVTENGKTNLWTFDAYNRASSYTDINSNLIQYRYDRNGNLTNLIYPGARNVYYGYDSNNRMTNVTDWAGRKTSIAYDLAGRITTIARPNGTFRTMGYDAAGQLTNIWEQMANTLPIAWCRFNWNNAAEMQWEFAAPLPHTNSPPSRTMTYDDDNRLYKMDGQKVTIDSDGNLTYGPLTNDNFVTLTFDARNRLSNAGGVTNTYDAINNRIGQTYGTNTTAYVVNPNAALPQVLMRVKNGVTNYYVYGPGLLYQVKETATATNTLTYHYDYRGSTIALTADNGLVTDRIEYSLYGSMTYRAGTNDTPFLFNGYFGVQTDPNGLLYMRARYYSPYICRFLSPDPSGFAAGLNMYAFCDGNPISLVDPFGLGTIEGWGGATSTWINRNIVSPLNSVSTTSTTVNFRAYMAGSVIGGLGDLFRVGQGTAYATYDAQDGWQVAIGVSQDVARSCGLATLVAGGLQGAVDDLGDTAVAAKVMSESGAQGSFSAADLANAILSDPIALRAYRILQEQGIDVRLYSSADNLAGSAGNGVVNINLANNATVEDALSTLIHEAKHIDLEANTGNLYGLRGTQSGEYSARALEFFYNTGRRPNAAERAAIQQQIQTLGY